jgi:hypothetical protein
MMTEYEGAHAVSGHSKAPSKIKWVPRLREDVYSLQNLFYLETPLKQLV